MRSVTIFVVVALAAVLVGLWMRAEQRAIVAEQRVIVAEQRATMAEQQATVAEQQATVAEQQATVAEQRAADPDWGKRVAIQAFREAELWRKDLVDKLYAHMTDEDWDTAARWTKHASPFDAHRSCSGTEEAEDSWEDLLVALASARGVEPTMWGVRQRQAIISLQAYHSTGLEGNTLTLPETAMVVDGKELFAGFPDHLASPSTGPSVLEARNLAQVWSAFRLDLLPTLDSYDVGNIAMDWNINQQTLVDMQAALMRDTDTPTGYRRHPATVGHQKVLLPMPDELPALMQQYIKWLTEAVRHVDAAPAQGSRMRQSVALACDAHTRLVHIHPFADGNGRLARTLAGMVLQRFGLPAPMFSRHDRNMYMAAVSDATIRRDYAQICNLNVLAVVRSLKSIVNISQDTTLQQ
jgi:prophage maintenance system killer protein